MYNNFTDSHNEYQSCSLILPPLLGSGGLLIGDFNSATDAEQIKTHNIKTIITAAIGMEHLQVPPNILHITFPLLDGKSENIRRFFEDSYSLIKASINIVMQIYSKVESLCTVLPEYQGYILSQVQSATLVIAFLMKCRKISFRQAIGVVRSKRRTICPNLGFERQLKQYEKQLEGGHNKVNLKKTISEKISEERKTIHNNVNTLSGNKESIKFQPRTAEHSVRKKLESGQNVRKPPYSYSQSRPRDRKNFQIRPVNKEMLFVYGQNQLTQIDSLHLSQKVPAPLIQMHGRNGYSGIAKFIKRNY